MGGSDKTLLSLDGAPMLRSIADRLRVQVDQVAISSNSDPASLPDLGLPLLADSISGFQGPLAGILAGLEWAAAIKARWLLSVAGDTPFFPVDIAERLISSVQQDEIVVAASNRGLHPVFALWPTEFAQELRGHLESGGSRKVLAFIQDHAHASVPFADVTLPGGRIDPFFNINTPEDLAEARRLLQDGSI